MVFAATVLIGCKNGGKNSSEKAAETTESVDSTVVDSHNSKNSLDWAGVYGGTMPCADCEGIKTVLELKYDNTYVLAQTYLGSPDIENQFKEQGDFSWSQDGALIRLNTDSGRFRFKVGENQLWMLDEKGNMIEGDLADMYILKKTIQ